jgi:hypothetical protein
MRARGQEIARAWLTKNTEGDVERGKAIEEAECVNGEEGEQNVHRGARAVQTGFHGIRIIMEGQSDNHIVPLQGEGMGGESDFRGATLQGLWPRTHHRIQREQRCQEMAEQRKKAERH